MIDLKHWHNRKRFCSAKVAFFLLIWPAKLYAASPDAEKYPQQYLTQKNDFAMEQAAIDLAANADFWVELRQEVDGAVGFGWRALLARKLTSQPIAVLNIMKRTQTPAIQVCSPPFIEAPYYEVNDWLVRTQHTLQAFTMVDNSLEQLRLQCLDIVNKTPHLKPEK